MLYRGIKQLSRAEREACSVGEVEMTLSILQDAELITIRVLVQPP